MEVNKVEACATFPYSLRTKKARTEPSGPCVFDGENGLLSSGLVARSTLAALFAEAEEERISAATVRVVQHVG